MQTIMYRLDKQDPTVQYGKLYSISYDKPQWKRILKKWIYVYNWVTLLYSRNEYNIVNKLYFNKNKFKKFLFWPFKLFLTALLITKFPTCTNLILNFKLPTVYPKFFFHFNLGWKKDFVFSPFRFNSK